GRNSSSGGEVPLWKIQVGGARGGTGAEADRYGSTDKQRRTAGGLGEGGEKVARRAYTAGIRGSGAVLRPLFDRAIPALVAGAGRICSSDIERRGAWAMGRRAGDPTQDTTAGAGRRPVDERDHRGGAASEEA